MNIDTPEQKALNSLYYEARHLCSLCKCPSYLAQKDLELIVRILKGEMYE